MPHRSHGIINCTFIKSGIRHQTTETLEQDVLFGWLVGLLLKEEENTLIGIGNFRKQKLFLFLNLLSLDKMKFLIKLQHGIKWNNL